MCQSSCCAGVMPRPQSTRQEMVAAVLEHAHEHAQWRSSRRALLQRTPLLPRMPRLLAESKAPRLLHAATSSSYTLP